MNAQPEVTPATTLDAGLNLFTPFTRAAFRGRVRMSSGTRPADRRDAGVPPYRHGAFVPADPWLPPADDDLDRSFARQGDWANWRSLCVAGLPPATRRALEALCPPTLPLAGPDPDDDGLALGAACLALLSDWFDCSPATRCHGVGVNRPGMATTSIDRNIDRLVGLHVDHWDGLPLTRRNTAGNRLAINAGTEPYYILLMPTTLAEMARLTGQALSDGVDLNALPGAFLAAYPANPVYRIRIDPGEVYVAPTDNLIHDGSTQDGRVEARQIVFRGDIRPTARLMAACAGR